MLTFRKQSPVTMPDRPWNRGAYDQRYEPETRRDFVHAARDRVWVKRSVELIANSSNQARLRAYRGKLTPQGPGPDAKEVESPAVLDLFRRPTPRDPALLFMAWSLWWSQVVGEWYWEAVPARGGGIAQLSPLRAHLVQVKPGEGGKPAGFVYDPDEDGNVIELPWADPEAGRLEKGAVVCGRFANPLDDWYGMPPLRGAKDDVVSEYYATRYDHRFFRNSARPDIIVGFKEKLDKGQRRDNREAWDEFKGVDRAHKAAVMDGDPTVVELGKSPRDATYIEGRRLFREGECAAFGVPPVLVGILDHATYSNYKEARRIFWESTMVPLLDFMALWATFTVVPFFSDVDFVWFDTSEVEALQETEGERVDRHTRLVGGGLETINEGRDELGLEARDEDEADVLHLPMSLVPIKATIDETPQPALPSAPPQNQPPAPGDQPGAVPGDGQPIPDDQPQLPPAKGRTLAADPIRAARMRLIKEALLSVVIPPAASATAAFFVKQEAAIMRLLEVGKGKDRKARDLVEALQSHGWDKDAQVLEQLVRQLHVAVGAAAAGHVEQLLGVEVHMGGEDDPALARVLTALANRPDGIRSVPGRVQGDVLEQVRIGIQHGLTTRQIATGGSFEVGDETVGIKGVAGVYDELKTWQAERIARSEAATAYNRTSAAAMRDAGVQYVDIVDGEEDEDCAAANGQRWTVDEYDSDPLAHPNCSRIGLPVVE